MSNKVMQQQTNPKVIQVRRTCDLAMCSVVISFRDMQAERIT